MVPEIEKRNLMRTIDECMQEHKVNLRQGKSRENFYLIEAGYKGNTADDFDTTYPQATPFQKSVARKLFGQDTPQAYGVLVDKDMKYQFAFNRKFADLNDKRDKLVFVSADDFLLEEVEVASTSLPSFSAENLGGGITVRYSLRSGKQDITTGKVAFTNPSLLGRVSEGLAKRKVRAADLSDMFYLIEMEYKTPTLPDFLRTYEGDLDKFKMRMAERTFGGLDIKKDNTYGVLISNDLQMQFAFNTLFAKYDPIKKIISFQSAEQALLNAQIKPVQKIKVPPRQNGGGMMMRYSLAGKKN